MKISIVIPVYNVADYVETCVRSVLSCERSDVEVIAVDDGSTDQSARLLSELAAGDTRLRVVRKSNGGLSSARNAGIKAASGDYVLFLDGDDYLCEGAVAKVAARLTSNPDALMLGYCDDFAGVLEPGRSLDLGWLDADDGVRGAFERIASLPMAWQFVVRRSLLLQRDLFFKEGYYHEDEEWTPRLLVALKTLAFLPEAVYCYRRNRAHSIMSQSGSPQKRLDLLRIVGDLRALSNQYASDWRGDCLRTRAAGLYFRSLLLGHAEADPSGSVLLPAMAREAGVLKDRPQLKYWGAYWLIQTCGVAFTSAILRRVLHLRQALGS